MDRSENAHSDTPVRAGNFDVNVTQHCVIRNGAPVELSWVEWGLLSTLVEAGGAPITPEELLIRVWGPSYRRDEAYLAVAVWHLRRKLETEAAKPAFINTTPTGYLFDPCGQVYCTCLTPDASETCLDQGRAPNLVPFPTIAASS